MGPRPSQNSLQDLNKAMTRAKEGSGRMSVSRKGTMKTSILSELVGSRNKRTARVILELPILISEKNQSLVSDKATKVAIVRVYLEEKDINKLDSRTKAQTKI